MMKDREMVFQFQAEEGGLAAFKTCRQAPATTQLHIQIVWWTLFQGIERLGRVADQTHLSRSKFKNDWNNNSSSAYTWSVQEVRNSRE